MPYLYRQISQTAADSTNTFVIETGMNSKNLQAWRFDAIDVYWDMNVANFGAGDWVAFEVWVGAALTGQLIFRTGWHSMSASTAQHLLNQHVRWPGGGLLQNPERYFLVIRSSGLAVACSLHMYAWYEVEYLTPESWLLVKELGAV